MTATPMAERLRSPFLDQKHSALREEAAEVIEQLYQALKRTRDRLGLLVAMEEACGAPESKGNAAIYRHDIATAEAALAKARGEAA